jgi:hypothetical protein
MFDIKEGILKCNDDLIFNENNLETFLRSSKKYRINESEYIDIDYLGRENIDKDYVVNESNEGYYMINHNYTYEPNKSWHQFYLTNYYRTHQEDFDNPQHNLKNVDIEKYQMTPYIPSFIAGPLMYLSNKSCKILMNHMININYNIYSYDDKTNSYPYNLEDIGIAFILFSNNINLIDSKYWYCNTLEHQAHMYIAVHTNKYK